MLVERGGEHAFFEDGAYNLESACFACKVGVEEAFAVADEHLIEAVMRFLPVARNERNRAAFFEEGTHGSNLRGADVQFARYAFCELVLLHAECVHKVLV
ncbi:hypothetical protein TPSea814_000923a [Treponema pallidum subsp. pallidum str. Sea 81-4]|nr:hypothetical protein TPSea814_000923a [Treponema pallidum subsp. pallidum str. Sea 81-4]